jgi:hypothetical protein
MFTKSQNQAAEIRRLQDMAIIHHAAKHRAEQLRQEAIDSLFQTMGSTVVAVLAAARRALRIAARQPSAPQTRALEN